MEPSRRMRKLLQSQTLAITDRAKQLKRQGVDVIQLSAGEPDFDTPDHIKEAAIKAIRDGHTKYTPSTGIAELREAVASHLRETTGANYDTSEIIITAGGKFAIFGGVLALCDEGDEVIVLSPHWVSYPQIVLLAGATPRYLKLALAAGYKLDPRELRRAIGPKTKLVILNNPCNPTGAVLQSAELEPIVEVLVEAGVWVLADEIYERLVYDEVKFRSLASFPELRERLILVNGFSKAYAMTGWRVGYLAAPRRVALEVSKIVSHSTSNPSSVSQYAAVAALHGDQSCVERMRREFQRRRDFAHKRLSEIPGLRCSKPGGAFYMFPDVSAYLGHPGGPANSVDLCQWLLEEWHVAVVPGSAFGAEGHIRISFASSMELLAKGIDRIAKALAELRSALGLTERDLAQAATVTK